MNYGSIKSVAPQFVGDSGLESVGNNIRDLVFEVSCHYFQFGQIAFYDFHISDCVSL